MNDTTTVKTQAVLPKTDLQLARDQFAQALKTFIESPLPENWKAVETTKAEVERIDKRYHDDYVRLLAHVCNKQGKKS